MTKVITLSELVANIRCRRNGKTFLANFVNQCEFSDAVIIPPNATNRDVLKAIFPNMEMQEPYVETTQSGVIETEKHCKFCCTGSLDWLDAPYDTGKSIAQCLAESEGD